MVWGQMECQLAIVCASAPALKAFISNVKKGTIRSTSKKSSSYATPLSPISNGRSNATTDFEGDVAEGKGILVTETLSLKSASATPPHNALGRQSQQFTPPIDHVLSMSEESEWPAYSSPTGLARPLHPHNLPTSPIEQMPIVASENPLERRPSLQNTLERRPSFQNPLDRRPSFQNYTPRYDVERFMSTYRPYSEQEKALKVLGG
jgi:hypothetical protein